MMAEILNFIFKNFHFFSNIYIENFHTIFNSISNEDTICQRLLIDKFFCLIEEKEIKDLRIIHSNNNSNNYTLPITNIIKNFDKILPSLKTNEEFFGSIIIKFDMFIEYFIFSNNRDWTHAATFLKALIKCEIIFENLDFLNKFYAFIMEFLKTSEKDSNNLNKNFKILKLACKTLPYILKYSNKNTRDEILKFVEKEFVDSKSFYRRRYFFPFFKKCVKIFSITYLKENLLIENMKKFINDNCCFIRGLIMTLKLIVPLITEDIKLKNSIFSNLEEIKNSTKDAEIKKVIL